MRLLRLLGLDARGRGPGLDDQLLAVLAGLLQDGEALRLDPRELRLDPVGVREAVGDLLPPRREHREDGLVREDVEDRAHDAEADGLRDQVRPVDAERPRDRLHGAAALGDGLQREYMHGHELTSSGVRRADARDDASPHQEERVEDDGFGQGDGENRLDHDLRRRAGIASDRGRRAHPDQSHADRGAERRQAHMQATGHLRRPF
jgi:hypothetical protein